MRALWVKAPLLLRRYPPVLAAAVVMSALAALSAASLPLVRAGVESESLQGRLRAMTPLAAGFEVRTFGVAASRDRARRAAATRLGRTLPFLGAPVLSSLVPLQVAGSAAPGLELVALARTNAVAHVGRVTRADGRGVWIADSTAKVTHLRPGDTLRLTVHVFMGSHPRVVGVRVAGVYRALEGDRDNPYWTNWQHDIRSEDPNDPPPPAFVLMSQPTFERTARILFPRIENRYEFPVDPHHVSFAGARGLDHRLKSLAQRITRANLGLACHPQNCETSSSLSAALTVAASDVSAVSPTIALLAGIGLALAFGLAVATGLFLVRRRTDEAQALFARGEAAAVFGARTALETVLPAFAGLALGAGLALLALRSLAPAGTITHATAWGAIARAGVASAAVVVCTAAGAAVGFPRRRDVQPPHARRLARIPWEIVPLAVAAVLIALIEAGKGLAQDASGGNHPRLVVFLVPVLAVTGAAGLALRLARLALRGRGSRAPAPVFLALRRIGAARGSLVAVVVTAATAFGTFAYAATLSASLTRSTAEKAFVSNGSDVQGVVDPSNRITTPFPFPVALAELDQANVSFASGERVDLIAGDPRSLERTLLWGKGWRDDPRRLLRRRLEEPGRGLAAIATPGAPSADAIVDQGARIPIRIVGRAPIPGSTAGRPALLVSRPALRRAARRAHILDPGPETSGLLWAKGPASRLLPVLERSNLAPTYMTTLGHIRDNASVAAAARSYRFVKIVGVAAAAAALIALLLYLQARQRSQVIASALLRRMGLGARADAAAVALEAGAVVAFAAVVGAAAAALAARPIVHRVDSLPQYAPSPVFTLPWSTLFVGGACAIAAAMAIGVVAVAIAARADVAEALRVA